MIYDDKKKPIQYNKAKKNAATGLLHRVNLPHQETKPARPKTEALHNVKRPSADVGELTKREIRRSVAKNKVRLKINAGSLSFAFEGEPQAVSKAYESVRVQLLQEVKRTIPRPPISPRSRDTKRAAAKIKYPKRGYIWCRSYHECYQVTEVISRTDFRETKLGHLIHAEAIGAVYFDRVEEEQATRLIQSRKTLWSELTAEGRAQLRAEKK